MSARLPFWRVTLHDRSVYWSEAAFAMHGLPDGGAMPDLDTFVGLYNRAPSHDIGDTVDWAVRQRCGFELCARLQRPDGDRRIVACGRPEHDADGLAVSLSGVLIDMTEQRALFEELRERGHGGASAPEMDAVLLIGRDGGCRYASAQSWAVLRRTPAGLIARPLRDHAHPDDAPGLHAAIQAGFARGWIETQYRAMLPDGGLAWIEARGRLHAPTGEMILRVRNVETSKREEERLRRSERLLHLLAENAVDLITSLGPDGRRTFVSRSSLPMLGYHPEELIGRTAEELCFADDWRLVRGALEAARHADAPPAGIGAIRFRLWRKDRSLLWVEATMRIDPSSGNVIGVTRDVSSHVMLEAELSAVSENLRLIARQDGLTGLANRRGFDEALRREWRRAERHAQPLSLVMIDVDYFKNYNDRYGHAAGDASLKRIAGVIGQAAGRGTDLACRYGGEEFALILPDADPDGASFVAHEVRRAIEALAIEHAHPAASGGVVTASLGVATWYPSRLRGERFVAELLTIADECLYGAKNSGRNRVSVCAEPDRFEAAASGF